MKCVTDGCDGTLFLERNIIDGNMSYRIDEDGSVIELLSIEIISDTYEAYCPYCGERYFLLVETDIDDNPIKVAIV